MITQENCHDIDSKVKGQGHDFTSQIYLYLGYCLAESNEICAAHH